MQRAASVKRSATRTIEPLAGGLLHVDTIYHEPEVPDYARGRDVLARFPNARRVEVPSHWDIPELHGNADSVERRNQNKRTVLAGQRKGSRAGRSTAVATSSRPRRQTAVR